jgi:hypothetical protein
LHFTENLKLNDPAKQQAFCEEVLGMMATDEILKNGVFWDVTPCGSCKNRSVRRLLVTASIVPSSPILVTLMKEVQSSSETSVLTRATRCNIPDDIILHSHRREHLKSYIALTGWAL